MLENAADRKRISTILCTEANGIQNLPRQQSRILRKSCSKTLNRSRSKQSIAVKQGNKYKQSQNMFETKMYRRMLIESSIWQTQIMDNFQNIIKNQTSDIQRIVQNLQDLDLQFQDYFLNTAQNMKKVPLLAKIQQMHQIIKRQNQIINQLRIYQNQLQDIIKGFTAKLQNILNQKSNQHKGYFNNLKLGQNTQEQLVQSIKRWKTSNRDKQKRMSQQNKQLRQIVQQMIQLMNKKKLNTGRNF